ncbi:SipW-dependent-type signal peptide-containing protein [Enterococcus sp. AZ109]|uniref:SipW-dependent-type signal peptide-containing protein n=1 Tax=Enterococcus sp. AZ109 TaxID=2774634 RepID=UPI003F2580E8
MKKNRRKLIIVGLALIFVTVGTTYAWWTASQQVSQEIRMGNLNISATIRELNDPINYEPGLTAEQTGVIKNTGSIDAIIKIDNDAMVKFSGAADYEAVDPEVVKLSIKPNGGKGYWFSDSSNNTYVLLAPNQQAKILVETEFFGDKMGNEYMNADFKINGDLKATQVLDGAMLTEFGINGSQLTDYLASTSFSTATNSGETSEAMQYLQSLLKRGA